MTKLEIAKRATSFIVGVGTTKIVQGIVENNTHPEKVTDQVSILAGSIVIGSMVSDMTRKYTDAKIEEIAAWYNANVKNR
jgi:hypothetical protein